MPVTTRRAAAAFAAVEERVGGDGAVDISSDSDAAAVDISSDSDAGSESGSEDEESSSDEDYVDINDRCEGYIDITSNSETDDEEGSSAGEEEEANAEQSGVDLSEVACTKIADLLRRGRNLDGIKLIECKAYLKKNGLSVVGDIATCVERIILHWRFKDGDPEKIYPRSSFCINCKGDVCRGDNVLFKQKVYEKSGKKYSKCTGMRIVAGKVIKESYGKQKQQHTFTIQVFWSKGVDKVQPLYLLLIKGRNLYRMLTFRQPWANETDRLKHLEEKHSRGDAARRVRALKKLNSGGHVLKGKKLMEKGKHQSQCQRPDGESRIIKGKKRVTQSSSSDAPTKKSRKQEHLVSSGKNCTDNRRGKTNYAALEKNVCASSCSYLCNDNHETNHVTLQRNSHVAPVNHGLYSTEVRVSERNAGSKQENTAGGSHAHFEGRHINPASHVQPYRGNLVGIQQPCFQRPLKAPPFREVGNSWQPHIDGRSIACPNPRMAFQHQIAALAGWHLPVHFRGPPPNHPGVVFPPLNTSQTTYRPHPDGYVMPQFRYSSGNNGFTR